MRSTAIVLAALTVSGCGAAPPGSPPPAPPSVDSTKVSLSQLPLGQCPVGICLVARTELDSAGELTVLWLETPGTGANRLAAANIAPGGTVPLSTGNIESGFVPPSQLSFIARPLGQRRFAVLHRYGLVPPPATEPLRARLVEMDTSGSPTVSPAVELPDYLQFEAWPFDLFQDSMLQLYAVSRGVVSPFPAPELGPGVTLQTTGAPSMPMSQVILSRAAEFPQSAPPRIVWGIHGQETPTDPPGVYVAEQNLATGAVLPPLKLSTQPVTISNALGGCGSFVDLEPQAVVDLAGVRYAVAWRQLNANGDGCDLYVNGERLNSRSLTLTRYTVSLQRDGATVAVWEEQDRASGPPDGSSRVLWSRRDAGGGTWSTPAPIAPQFSPSTVEQHLGIGRRSPNGRLAVVWESAGVSGTLISKYQNGAWTTVKVGAFAGDARGLAINDSGQGAALFESGVACPPNGCLELAAYRF